MGGPSKSPRSARIRLLPGREHRKRTTVNAPLSTTDAPRRNIFPGRCAQCGGFVAKFSGYRKQGADKAWLIYCEPHYPALTTAPVLVSAPKESPMVATVPLADVPLPSARAARVVLGLLDRANEVDDAEGRQAIRELADIVLALGQLHGVEGSRAPADAEPVADAADVARDVLADLGLAAPREQALTVTPAANRVTATAPTRNADAASGLGLRRAARASKASKPAKSGDRWAALRTDDES